MPLPPILSGTTRLPVVGAPLFIISNPQLTIAQCKAGVIGAFPALNARPQSQLDEWLAEITETLADHDARNPTRRAAPFAVNQIVHKSNARLEQDLWSDALRFTSLISEPIVVLAAPQPRDARRFYTLAELSRTPVIVTEAIRAIVDDQIGRYGARLNVDFEVNAVEAIGQLLLRGVGPAVMPISTFHAEIASRTAVARWSG